MSLGSKATPAEESCHFPLISWVVRKGRSCLKFALAGTLVPGVVVDYLLRSPVLSQHLPSIDINTFATSSEFYNVEYSVLPNVISNMKAASHLNIQSQKCEYVVDETSASCFTCVCIQTWILRKAFISFGEVLRCFQLWLWETYKRYSSLFII